MGNNTGCSMLCQKTPIFETNLDEILITDYYVPCQMCNSQFTNPPSKEHIDLKHYAAYTNDNEQNAQIECLLCGKLSATLLQHNSHNNEKHPYAFKIEKLSKLDSLMVSDNAKEIKIIEQWELNKSKKASAVKLDSEKDFRITKEVQTNHYEATVRGVTYDVKKYSKQYKRNDQEQEHMEAELIWLNIFKHKKVCKYYYLDLEPGQRNVLCKGYIFYEQTP